MMLIKKISLCILMVSPLAAVQQEPQQVREFPSSLTYLYRYGLTPTAYMLALLAQAGWMTAQGAWWTTKSLAQGPYDTAKFTYNNPVTGCALISTNLFIAYMLYKMGQEQYHEAKRAFDGRMEQARNLLEDWRLGQNDDEIL